jgi:hypothetical protein
LNKIDSKVSWKDKDIMKEIRKLADNIDNMNTTMLKEFQRTQEINRIIRKSNSTDDLPTIKKK